jgi:2-octaprenylphenol hydroxylase
LQVWPAVMAQRACPYQHMKVWDADGTATIEFDASELDAPALGHIVENSVLTSALVEAVQAAADVEVISPARVESIAGLDSAAPAVRLQDGRDLRCSLVVGADGALSQIRKLAGIKTREWDYGHHALVCTVETELAHQNTAWQRFSSTGPLAFLPLNSIDGHHYCSIVWSVEADIAQSLLALEEPEFMLQLEVAFEHRLGKLLSCSQRGGFPLRQRHAIDYVRRGVALIGDAAHTIHPLAGQGINLGLQDVEVLAEEITRAVELGVEPGSLQVLGRYQRRRKGENLLMMAAMDGFKHLFAQQALPLRWLRNTGMRLIGNAGPLKQRLMRHAMGIR